MENIFWLKKAAALGCVFFLAILLSKPIGVSTQFSVFSGIVHCALDETVITRNDERKTGYESTNAYYDKGEGKLARSIQNPWNYDFVFVLAIPFGAYAAYCNSEKKRRVSPDDAEIEPGGERKFPWRRYLPSFLGGFILLFGARMAGGCTSGHMISGMMQGSVSGYLFAAAVFAAAIPLAIYNGRAPKGGRE